MGKSSPINLGNWNLKGKRSHPLGRRCCWALDLRDKLNEKILKQELSHELNPDEVAYMNSDAAYYEGCSWDLRNYYDLDI